MERTSGPKRKQGAGGWRRHEDLHNLDASLNMITVIKSRRIRWVGHVARLEAMRNAYNILVGKSEGKRPLRRSRLDGRIILEWILGKYGGKLWTGFICARIRSGGGLL
jgi:hypothetical protein